MQLVSNGFTVRSCGNSEINDGRFELEGVYQRVRREVVRVL